MPAPAPAKGGFAGMTPRGPHRESQMTSPKTIDVHAHVLTEETMRLLRAEAPSIGPQLKPIDGEQAVLEVAGTPYRPFPRGGWDLERRFADMDAAGVDMQV